jgi:hypothetical protein
MDNLRESIRKKRFAAFKKEFRDRFYGGQAS